MKNLTDFRKTVEDGMDPRLMLHRTDTRYCMQIVHLKRLEVLN